MLGMMVVMTMTVTVSMAVTLNMIIIGGRMRVKSFLHIQHVEVGYVIMTKIFMVHLHQLHFTKTQAQEQALKTLEIQAVLLTVTPEQLLDVVELLLL